MIFHDEPGPVALAHRGGGAEAPENSRAAVEHTVALGFSHLETDVHVTADGVVVLMHDATLGRTTNGTGPLAEHTWAQVARLRDGSGEAPLRLADVLAAHPGLRLNIDLKEDRVVGPAMRAIADAGAADRVCLAAFSGARLRAVRRLASGAVATSLGPAEAARLVAAARAPTALRRRLAATVPGPHDPRARAVAVQLPTQYRGVRVLDEALISLAHERGLHVHVWTIDDATEMRHLLDLGVDGLVTDRPTTLRDVLRERGQWHATGSQPGSGSPR